MFVFRLRLLQLLPVNATVGLVEATDVDSQPLFYRLETATVRTCRSGRLGPAPLSLSRSSVSPPTQDKYFRLENINSPKILVRSVLDYDVVQKVSLVLHVQVGPWGKGRRGSGSSSALSCQTPSRTPSTAPPPTSPSSPPWPPSPCTSKTWTTAHPGSSPVPGPTWGWRNCA